MKGVIVNYRRGRRTMHGNQMIVTFEGVDTKEKAAPLLGKTVVWETPAKKRIFGKVSKVHGNKGAVIVRFRKGMPGQSIGSNVEIVEKEESKKKTTKKK
ncbi:MAG: 50S ribosomal protein L35ae [Candidatus Diapherotrites archaeon]|nr:50S ribosomal protein L35ae [Candidatus Diapherotrites archaeon]